MICMFFSPSSDIYEGLVRRIQNPDVAFILKLLLLKLMTMISDWKQEEQSAWLCPKLD